MNKHIDKFCSQYQAKVRPSSQHMRRIKPMPLIAQAWNVAAIEDFNIEYDQIPCVEISMPEDRFRALVEHDQWIHTVGLQDNGHFSGGVSRVAQIIIDHERECRIRNENPAVAKAWDRYQMLLRLSNSHYD